MSSILDMQTTPLTVANDATEREIYSYTIPAGNNVSKSLRRLLLGGSLTTRALLPGTFTLTVKFAGLSIAVVSETLNLAAPGSNYFANLDCALIPGAFDVAAIGGFFSQNAADAFPTAGARSKSTSGVVDLSIDQPFTVTMQFDTADAANVFTRSSAILMLMNQ